MLIEYIGKLLHWKGYEGATLFPVEAKYARGIQTPSHNIGEGLPFGEVSQGQILALDEAGSVSGQQKPHYSLAQKVYLGGSGTLNAGYLLGFVPQASEIIRLRAQADAGSFNFTLEINPTTDPFGDVDPLVTAVANPSFTTAMFPYPIGIGWASNPLIAAGSWIWLCVSTVVTAEVAVVEVEIEPQ